MNDAKSIAAELAKPLDSRHVKPPAPGKYGDYIEGWHAIAEANRIFGWDGWTYTVDRLDVTNSDPNQGRKGDQWAVGYIAIVTVVAGDASRTDVGHGQGHAKAIGDAHDSAAKEAVTDALKRALRTFGYPLGLALYDKTKANVSNDPNAAERFEEDVAREIREIAKITDLDHLQSAWATLNKVAKAIASDPRVIKAKDDKKAELSQSEAA